MRRIDRRDEDLEDVLLPERVVAAGLRRDPAVVAAVEAHDESAAAKADPQSRPEPGRRAVRGAEQGHGRNRDDAVGRRESRDPNLAAARSELPLAEEVEPDEVAVRTTARERRRPRHVLVTVVPRRLPTVNENRWRGTVFSIEAIHPTPVESARPFRGAMTSPCTFIVRVTAIEIAAGTL